MLKQIVSMMNMSCETRAKELELEKAFFEATDAPLTAPQIYVLHTASQQHPSMNDLAEAMNCTRSNLTGITDRLEAGGFITRDRSPEDRRIILVRLTEKGEITLTKACGTIPV